MLREHRSGKDNKDWDVSSKERKYGNRKRNDTPDWKRIGKVWKVRVVCLQWEMDG